MSLRAFINEWKNELEVGLPEEKIWPIIHKYANRLSERQYSVLRKHAGSFVIHFVWGFDGRFMILSSRLGAYPHGGGNYPIVNHLDVPEIIEELGFPLHVSVDLPQPVVVVPDGFDSSEEVFLSEAWGRADHAYREEIKRLTCVAKEWQEL